MDHLKKKALLKTLCSFFGLLLYKTSKWPKEEKQYIANIFLRTDLPSTTALITSYIYSVNLTNMCVDPGFSVF